MSDKKTNRGGCWYGVRSTQMPITREDDSVSVFYSEVFPSTPLFSFRFNRHFPFIHKSGRSFRDPLSRWWFEVHEDRYDSNGYQLPGAHHWQQDGGSTTFRRAVDKSLHRVDSLYWDTILPGYEEKTAEWVKRIKEGGYSDDLMDEIFDE